ncbi:hypothetical protein EYF88_12050 [Paracoccus sediminis]|uniref:Uncharacterized protein n=1 Tax=Paracoccus sediminis TaxID=1214787 RepID=A0A238X4N9_9RHOB|nr:hypothetical protein [Paracoccus sediminis]TBN49301.1 hypothetical protein EYF88_12050 [Paracoccus sediminis]SNR52819.1 hypothetical protein SAMN06265378_10785 [Paracoccus sediminis]
MKHALILCACVALVPGCDASPEAYPRLLPTDQILAEPTLPDHAPAAATSPAVVDAQAEARAAALRRRADALRGPVIEPDALARIQSD